jgi:DNA polymerase I
MSGIIELLNLPTDTRSGDKEVLKRVKTDITQVNHYEEELQSQLDKYECIVDKERLHEYIDKVIEKGVCAIDTETMGLNPMIDSIVGISMYIEGEKGVYIPLKHISHITLQPLPNQISIADVSKELSKTIKNVNYIFHNYAFDRRVIKHSLGIILPCMWDTRTAWKYLNENESSALKVLYSKYIDSTEDFEDKTFNKLFHGSTFDRIPLKYATAYAGGDAEKTYKLYEFEKGIFARNDILKNIERVYLELDLPVQEVIAEMMDNGTKYDFEESARLLAEFEEGLKKAEAKINDILEKDKGSILAYKTHYPKSGLEYPLNLNSPKQIGIYLYDIRGYEPIEGKKSTGVADLKRINDDFCKALLEYRELEKISSTYLRALPNAVNKTTGRIHTTYDAYGAATGRMSSKNPNLQQIPSRHKEIRNIFVADTDCVFISADYSQQEPRILAYCSQDKQMIEAFTNGNDIYSWVASIIYKKPYEACLEHNPDGTINKEGNQLRTNMKSVILGIMYGRSASGIAEQLKIDREEAQGIIDDFYSAFPSVQKWQLRILTEAKKKGYVQTILGRKRRLPELKKMPYELKPKEGYTSVKDIFDFDSVSENDDKKQISNTDYQYFMKALLNCRSWKQKQEIIAEATRKCIYIEDNRNRIAEAERQAINSVIQGSASDMTKMSMLEVYNNQELRELGANLVMQIHDELIIECPKKHGERCAKLLQDCMIKSARKLIDIPMKCDTKIAERWGDL